MSLLKYMTKRISKNKLYAISVSEDRVIGDLKADATHWIISIPPPGTEQVNWSEDNPYKYWLSLWAKDKESAEEAAIHKVKDFKIQQLKLHRDDLQHRLDVLLQRYGVSHPPVTTQLMRDSFGNAIPIVDKLPSLDDLKPQDSQVVYCTEEPNRGYFIYSGKEWEECRLTAQPIRKIDYMEFTCDIIRPNRDLVIHKANER